jgi:CRISPR-associated Csx14 family protein
MSNILIATLGESPIVVTVMADLLRERGIVLDEVVVLYPEEPTVRYIEFGYELIEEAPAETCTVRPLRLPFADPNSQKYSITFLWLIAQELRQHESQGNAVYLSIAGGRKNMSALLAIMPQFYPCVRGLYHLLNPYDEGSPQSHLYTIEALYALPPDEHIRRLHPPLADFKLVELPYATIAQSAALQRWLSQSGDTDTPSPISVSPEAESFYAQVFRQAAPSKTRFTVRLTQTAYDEYCKLFQSRSEQRFLRHLHFMRDPDNFAKEDSKHLTEKYKGKTFHFYKQGGSAERTFYYTSPNSIEAYPQREVKEVIICGFSDHYDPSAEYWLKRGDLEPVKTLADLPSRAKEQPIALIAPLGLSPAVVTQAYVLLQRQSNTVARIHVIYPDGNPAIRGGAKMLETVCQRRNIPIERQPLPIPDVDDQQSCDAFLAALQSAIRSQREQHPNEAIALLISGGRKAMSALTMIAAQVMDVGQVYHTVITDPATEQRVQRETAYRVLKSHMPGEQMRLLFLEDRTEDELQHFAVFTVPVLHLHAQETGS